MVKTVIPETPPPAFWFGFEVPWAKLLAARVVLFGLLAIDALLAIRHAPRYGAGGFNVAQLPWLDDLGPTRISYEVCELIQSAIFVFAACGLATRVLLPIATAIYAWLYFGSQLDSYQHHYLVVLVLLIACCVPWQRPVGANAATRVRSWAVRLILVQLAVMYLWAAISKLDPAWLDGRTLSTQINPKPGDLIDLRHLIEATIGFKGMAVLVIVTELTLACTVWIPRAAIVAAPLGLLFHLGIVASGLEIGLFAWLMIGMYTLIIPDRLWIRCASRLPGLPRPALTGAQPWIVLGLGIAAGITLATQTRFEHATIAAAVIATGAIAIALIFARAGRMPTIAWVGVASALVFVAWLGVDRLSSASIDYYRFWAGSSRRLGDLAGAEHAYERLVDVAPNDASGHFQLGRLQLAANPASALVELDAAARLDPTHARALLEEARYFARTNRHDEAVAKAREAVHAEPANAEAATLFESLIANKKLAPARSDDEPHDDR